MPLHRSTRSLMGILCCLALGSVAHAADHGITGKKLLLKSKPKMVLISKDGQVVPGLAGSGSDPRCVAAGGSDSGASVKLSDGTNSVTLSMPCANWSANGAGTLYKYKDATGTPKVGKLKSGLLKVISPGMGTLPVPTTDAIINAQVTVGTDRYCMSFAGTGDGEKFLVKDTAFASCPQICGNNEREGTEACDGTDANLCYTGECYLCACIPPLTCGNGVIDAGESCDGSNTGDCPGPCLACSCAPVSTCGDNIRSGLEQCDGTDADACPGQCTPTCTCSYCGNLVREGLEECDSEPPASDCPSLVCNPSSCTCLASFCGNYIREGSEECDALGFTPDCPSGACNSNCTCLGSFCGNYIREGSEECDASGFTSDCPSGACNSNCTCYTPECGNGIPDIPPFGSEECDGSELYNCTTFCQSDCTCADLCTGGGSCPAGQVCSDLDPIGGTSICVQGSVPCGDGQFPTCGGVCPAGFQCIGTDVFVDGVLGSDCFCAPQGQTCGPTVSSSTDCNQCDNRIGSCPPGQVCRFHKVCSFSPTSCSVGCVVP